MAPVSSCANAPDRRGDVRWFRRRSLLVDKGVGNTVSQWKRHEHDKRVCLNQTDGG